jgi:Collagen triple helix repeat (20 copies)
MKRVFNRAKSPEPFGKAGLLVAILALVLATTGAAFAASGLNGKQKKEVEKIAKKFAGKPGPAGPAGATGPAGPAGAAGKNGSNGAPGAPGEPGPKGEEGSPWTAGGTLPAGATETGDWALSSSEEPLPISFPIPLEEGLEASHVFYIKEGQAGLEHGTECPGTPAEPKAAEGDLCIYMSDLPSFLKTFAQGGVNVSKAAALGGGTDASGALVSPGEPEKIGKGTWAVTGG